MDAESESLRSALSVLAVQTSAAQLALWLVVFGLLLLNAFLGMAETALTRCSYIKMMAMDEEGRRGARRVLTLLDEPARFLNVILLTTLGVQFFAASLTALLVEEIFSKAYVSIATFVLTIVTFIFAESMPKTYAVSHPEEVSIVVAPLVSLLTKLLYPVARALVGVSNIILPGKGSPEGAFSELEIRRIVEQASPEVHAEEKRMIHSIFEFGDTVVREVMTPRPDVVALPDTAAIDEVLEVVVAKGYSRVPVYSGDLDSVTGIVYSKDILRAMHEGRAKLQAKDIARQPRFVPEQKKVSELLHEMQEQKFHMAIVVNEHGATAGLVTLEDLLEEIVGEIADEFDVDEPNIEPLDHDSVRVRGRLSIDDLNESLGLKLKGDGFDTVGGLILKQLGRLPNEGESVEFEGLEFIPERVLKRRIMSVVIRGLSARLQATSGENAKNSGANEGAST
jgi:CBS domain containing-hemolysin-like protein